MENTSIYAALAAVQSELKAPKGQFNKFGGYHYRSCEDILEAVKPILKAHDLALHLADEPAMVGERYYIKATATLTDFAGQQISSTAYAREALDKKGMDDSQITGTASSYARKYALNGLFCIDDTKDADTDEYQAAGCQNPAGGKKTPKQPAPKREAPAPKRDPEVQAALDNFKAPLICSDCGKPVHDVMYKDARIFNTKIAKETKEKYGRVLCWECAKKQSKEG